MPSAGKSVVELVTSDDRHVAWVEVNQADRAVVSPGDPEALRLPVVLLWGTRLFVWRTVSQGGFFVFAEAAVIVSRTPAPGLAAPDGSAPEGAEPQFCVVPRTVFTVFPAEAQERLAEQVAAVNFRGSLADPKPERRWCEVGGTYNDECACSSCSLERGEPSL